MSFRWRHRRCLWVLLLSWLECPDTQDVLLPLIFLLLCCCSESPGSPAPPSAAAAAPPAGSLPVVQQQQQPWAPVQTENAVNVRLLIDPWNISVEWCVCLRMIDGLWKRMIDLLLVIVSARSVWLKFAYYSLLMKCFQNVFRLLEAGWSQFNLLIAAVIDGFRVFLCFLFDRFFFLKLSAWLINQKLQIRSQLQLCTSAGIYQAKMYLMPAGKQKIQKIGVLNNNKKSPNQTAKCFLSASAEAPVCRFEQFVETKPYSPPWRHTTYEFSLS